MRNHPESTFGDYIIKLILLHFDSARVNRAAIDYGPAGGK